MIHVDKLVKENIKSVCELNWYEMIIDKILMKCKYQFICAEK